LPAAHESHIDPAIALVAKGRYCVDALAKRPALRGTVRSPAARDGLFAGFTVETKSDRRN
jgi:hypothetical protein